MSTIAPCSSFARRASSMSWSWTICSATFLSDCAAMITGSLGMLPSASLSAIGPDGRRRALYEPVHGSAPDIAGQGKANPLAAILSLGMALELSFDRADDARLLDRAIELALADKR